MKRKGLAVLILASLFLVAFTSPVFAQGEEVSFEEQEMEQEKLNPVLQIIIDFFRDLFVPEEPVVDDPPEGTVPGPEDDLPPEDEPGEEEPVLTPEEIISAYHDEDDLGMGVMVKVFDMAAALKAQCEATGENCDVDVESLLAEIESGVGIGELMEKYGKPEHMGVGQIRDKKSQSQEKVKNNNGNAIGKDK